MKARAIIGKRIVGIVHGRMSSNNRMRTVEEALILEDERGRRSYLRFDVVEETDAAFYGVSLIYPAASEEELAARHSPKQADPAHVHQPERDPQ